MNRKYWLTQHWPHPLDPKRDPGWHIFLQHQYRNRGNAVNVGDGVLFYEMPKGKRGIDPDTGAPILLPKGRKAVVLAASVVAELEQKSRDTTIYEDGTTAKWHWRIPCGFHESGTHVPLSAIRAVLNKKTIRPHAGLKELTEDHFTELRSLLIDTHRTAQTPSAPRKRVDTLRAIDPADDEIIRSIASPEGRKRYVRHLVYERDRKLVRLKKAQVLAHDKTLRCEACKMDYGHVYGPIGEGFIECHHLNWLSRSGETVTVLDDLAILCADCHRMIHKGGFATIAELRREMKQHQ